MGQEVGGKQEVSNERLSSVENMADMYHRGCNTAVDVVLQVQIDSSHGRGKMARFRSQGESKARI